MAERGMHACISRGRCQLQALTLHKQALGEDCGLQRPAPLPQAHATSHVTGQRETPGSAGHPRRGGQHHALPAAIQPCTQQPPPFPNERASLPGQQMYVHTRYKKVDPIYCEHQSGAHLDQQAAVIEVAGLHVHMAGAQVQPEGLGAPPGHPDLVLHACRQLRDRGRVGHGFRMLRCPGNISSACICVLCI